MKKASLKGYILYDAIYKIFLQRQNYTKREPISDLSGAREVKGVGGYDCKVRT